MKVIKKKIYRYTFIASNYKKFNLDKIKQRNVFTDDELKSAKMLFNDTVLRIDLERDYNLSLKQWESLIKSHYAIML